MAAYGEGGVAKRQGGWWGGEGMTQRSTGHKQEPKAEDQMRKATQGPGSRFELARQVVQRC